MRKLGQAKAYCKSLDNADRLRLTAGLRRFLLAADAERVAWHLAGNLRVSQQLFNNGGVPTDHFLVDRSLGLDPG